VLSGALPGHAALYGVLSHMEALGLELLECAAPAGEPRNGPAKEVNHQNNVMPAHQAGSQAWCRAVST
jgi:hypothetical protein